MFFAKTQSTGYRVLDSLDANGPSERRSNVADINACLAEVVDMARFGGDEVEASVRRLLRACSAQGVDVKEALCRPVAGGRVPLSEVIHSRNRPALQLVFDALPEQWAKAERFEKRKGRLIEWDVYPQTAIGFERGSRGIVYVGDFLNGQRSGQGCLYFSPSIYWQGTFSDNERNGEFMCYDAYSNPKKTYSIYADDKLRASLPGPKIDPPVSHLTSLMERFWRKGKSE